ncbi:peptide chain release factor 3 [Rhodothalassium salexigens]|uniref:peptide chain release factor 3 n=1 Tax=Rhodothalassium salexigens TaxID=1086 RepID=UPI001911DC2E|nr:peptide chain release factor 3 [Rhodothalassium salexigens]MBK5912011.1 peptide chain release factor 3 [Rhodothalassium salexigens]MBK5922169.1 peptide chain release factor 3 [Rhodothalassium salexigens]
MEALTDAINARRTFAIISHPDAGKTTLTEKLLLFGGAIETAGAVKARGERRRARSDWMKVEQERGISVASSVMTYEYDGRTFNLLDTPGHEDFSEDTYRVLTAVDSAVMVLDAAKGIETQTRKLFEVCRLRDMPITTFVNKLDREGQDPFGLLEEIEETLQLDVTPASWPIGMGRDFHGCYDLFQDQLILFDKGGNDTRSEGVALHGLDDPKLDAMLPDHLVAKLREDVEMVRGLCPPFDAEAYLAGNLTPVYFGSAVNNFGVRELLDGLARQAPPPRPQPALERAVAPDEAKCSGFVFKIQANMDPKHRDRMAFLRLVSGQFKKGMKLKHVRSGKTMAVHNAQLFLARDREVAETAVAGDIIGLPNHGGLRIGDTLTEGELVRFTGVPSFAPELLQRVRPEDPMKAKHLGRALEQLAEEGAARVFKPYLGADWVVGVVGALQFDVLADRIRTEFNVPVRFEPTELMTARWVEADDPHLLKQFIDKNKASLAEDHTGAPVYMARNAWHLNKPMEDFPGLRFLKTKEESV